MYKVVVIGPESTGKSTLCRQLAQHYRENWVREYARGYLMVHGTDYSYDELLTIAKGQLSLEEAVTAQSNGKLLFIDTDMHVMQVWCEFVYQQCHQWILDRIVERKYDLYLLCAPDLPWVSDELREYPDLESREQLFHIYKDIMVNQSVPWIEISGSYEERFQKALDAVQRLLQ
ncbi:MAG: AAA family ATPase [Chitinophagaceae bacterium]